MSHAELGFGTLRLKKDSRKNIVYEACEEAVDYYLALGGRYFEVAAAYRQTEETICKILMNRCGREDYVLVDKMPVHSKQIRVREDFDRIFDEQRQRCHTEYFDYYLLHNLGHATFLKMEQLGAFEFLSSLKRHGLARSVGFSFHDKADMLDEILSKHSAVVDVVQLQINYLDWDSPVIQSEACYEVARKYGKDILVMEPLKGGRLINLPPEALELINTRLPRETPASLGLRFPASLPGVRYVLSGMNETSQIQQNMKVFSPFRPLSDGEREVIDEVRRILHSHDGIECTQCGYCEKVCPKKIPIPELLHLYENDNKDRVGRMYVRITRDEGRGCAGDCVKCGQCEKECSQSLPIRQLLEEVRKVYEPEPTIKQRVKLLAKRLMRGIGIN